MTGAATSQAAAGRTIATTCPYCGVGCGILATVNSDGAVATRGDPVHPANYGRLCSKGAALADTLGGEGRLLHPSIYGRTCGWDEALDHTARALMSVRDRYGPDAIAFYVSGQLLTEDYYVANKLVKGFIGTGNIDTNSRLCMASAVAGHVRAFGADAVPGCYEDLELADLVVLVGSNTAWCHPVVYQRIARARELRPEVRVVVIDPRRTATCEAADLHLPLRAGSDVMLFSGLLSYLQRHDCLDYSFMERSTEGFDAALEAAQQAAPSISRVARACGVEEQPLGEFYRLFARTERVVTVFSQGVNQSSSGTDKVNSIINCHLATGRIGRPGMGAFSITGQPNAMGGREVGGMANQLAAHMRFGEPADVDRVKRFWGAERMATGPGLKAVDLFDAVAAGKVRAVWIMATNPVVTLPDADRVREALRGCELVIVSDCTHTDTTACADVLFPATTWGEKDGTVTNSERRISRQRPFLEPPGEARPDWWIVTQVARRLGFAEQFPYRHVADVFAEHAGLSGFENDGRRAFDISALSGIDRRGYDSLGPLQWPASARSPKGTARLYGDGRFYTPSGRARLIATAPRGPGRPTDDEFPLVLNTGRVRDQWHTMTRTGVSPRLTQHKAEPFVEIHPEDARKYSVSDGALASISSRWGTMLARVAVSSQQRPGSLFIPMHWNDRYAAAGRVDAVVNPVTDPVSGQPELKHTPVRIAPYRAAWYGFALARHDLDPRSVNYWVRVQGRGFTRYELAGDAIPPHWRAWARGLLYGETESGGQWLDFWDTGAGRYRAARVNGRRLEACLFVDRDPGLPGRAWLAELFSADTLTEPQRACLLAGSPGSGRRGGGRLVCSCFGVGEDAIREAVVRDGLNSVDAVGRGLRAGTNCGSCVPEIRAIVTACGG